MQPGALPINSFPWGFTSMSVLCLGRLGTPRIMQK